MATGSSNGRQVRFGAFEADLQAGELRKSGIKVRLQDQPFRVLALLLERSGEVVSREELRTEIWPDDTFVDFDHSLNTAINKIREALGDSASHPRFVETIPRRGYRFVFPVRGLASPKELSRERSSVSSKLGTGTRWKAAWALAGLALFSIAFGFFFVDGPSDSEGTLVLSRPVQVTRDSGLTYQPALSSDGKLLAYSSDRAGKGNLDIYVQQVGRSEWIQLTDDPADDWFPSFSPDGTQVAFRSERDGGGVYLVGALGGDPTLLVPEGRSPQFSPDSESIAYWKGLGSYGTGVYMISTKGGPPVELQTNVSHASLPLWSPRGTHLMVWGREEEQRLDGRGPELYVVPRKGGKAIKTGFAEVLAEAGLECRDLTFGARPLWKGGEWAADHSYIFGAVNPPGGPVNVYRVPISPETFQIVGAPQAVTRGTNEWQPALADDGLIAFVEQEQSLDLWSVRIDANHGRVIGGLHREVEPGPRYGFPAASADGRKLVFNSNSRGNHDIWIKDLASGKKELVLATAAHEYMPAISPDGSKVAALRSPFKYKELVWVPSSGGQETKLRGGVSELANWSPDSRRILYRSRDTRSWLTVNVTTGDEIEVFTPPGEGRGQAQLSPDGAWISFVLRSGPPPRTLVVAPLRNGKAADREKWVDITPVEGLTRHWWSPDSNLLYFLWARKGPFEIWAQPLDERTKRPKGERFKVEVELEPRFGLSGHTYALTSERLYFVLEQTTGNIWFAEPPKN